MAKIVKVLDYDKNPVNISSLGVVTAEINTNTTDYEIIDVLIGEYKTGPEKAVITKHKVNHYNSWNVTFANLHNGVVEFNVQILVIDQP